MKTMTTFTPMHHLNLHSTTTSIPEASEKPADIDKQAFHDPIDDPGERLIVLCEPISPSVAMRVCLDLLRYESSSPGAPIHLHLFSPGGCVVSGLAIVDTMRHLSSPVFTYSIGYAASMAAVILACGEKDHRYILPHSRVMIHQASGSVGGTLDNVRATLTFQNSLEEDCDQLLAAATGHDIQRIREASRVDNWMHAEAAREFGLVDHILASHPKFKSL